MHTSLQHTLASVSPPCFASILLMIATATAQTPAVTLDSRSQALVQQRQSSLNQGAQQFVAGNSAAGEQSVFAGIEQKQSTPGWYEEAGQRLYALALRLRSERQPVAAWNAVNSALKQLDQSVTLALARGNNVAAARAHEQAGMIYEHFLADVRSASARLQESVRLNPSGKTNVREAERLRQAESDLNRRSGRS